MHLTKDIYFFFYFEKILLFCPDFVLFNTYEKKITYVLSLQKKKNIAPPLFKLNICI